MTAIFYTDGEKAKNAAFPNNAFLNGDAVKTYFFVRNQQLIMAEECYFFLMASMRKMRMDIPLSYTLEYFTEIFQQAIKENAFNNGTIELLSYRNREEEITAKTPVHLWYELQPCEEVLSIRGSMELDLIKEISVNTHLLSNIRTHAPENTYAAIYAKENDLDEVILLNPEKRMARTVSGNLLLLEGNKIKIPKQSEGAYISPLMENFVTHVFKNGLAEIEETELSAFESQKAEEILVISDAKGVFSVSKIRNKIFGKERFEAMVASWRNSFA